jgi:hypothetical protein
MWGTSAVISFAFHCIKSGSTECSALEETWQQRRADGTSPRLLCLSPLARVQSCRWFPHISFCTCTHLWQYRFSLFCGSLHECCLSESDGLQGSSSVFRDWYIRSSSGQHKQVDSVSPHPKGEKGGWSLNKEEQYFIQVSICMVSDNLHVMTQDCGWYHAEW